MDLSSRYEEYIRCLNQRELSRLSSYVGNDVVHNGKQLGLAGYQAMLAANYEEIPDLHFHVDLLVIQPPFVAAILHFDCHPTARFLGIEINGRHVIFNENVFYRYSEGKIQEVRSVIDKQRIEDMIHQRCE
ncbi:ester cyclase [Terriglobus albidus]|uniref:ester cyclase n=1 Tax=Terriglobus albidus TaxID=1592106 RepID=UPI0037D9E944